jgi:hypothetical protein
MTRRREALRAFRRIAIGIAAIPLAICAWAEWMDRHPTPSFVILDNANDYPVDIMVNDKPVFLAARTHRRITVEPQPYRLRATGPTGTVVDEGSFTVPPRVNRAPFAGLYNIAGRGRYVLVSLCYGGPHCDQGIDRVGDGMRFFPIQIQEWEDLDQTIPRRTGGSGVLTRRFLCHAGATATEHGCPSE